MLLEAPIHGDAIVTFPVARRSPAVEYFLQRWNAQEPGFAVRSVPALDAIEHSLGATWVGAPGDKVQASALYESIRHLPGVSPRWTGERSDLTFHMTSLLDAHCTKATGLAEFAARHGIGLHQIMAVGDDFNDIEMLQEVGWGVAMGHAPDAVKAVANAVTLDNTEDGCALAIERYVLGVGAS